MNRVYTCSFRITRQNPSPSRRYWYTNHGAASARNRSAAPIQAKKSCRSRERVSASDSAATPRKTGRKSAATNFVMKPSRKYRATATICQRRVRHRRRLGPGQVVEDAAAVTQQQRGLHVVAAETVLEEQRSVDEQHHHRDGAADRAGRAGGRSRRRRGTRRRRTARPRNAGRTRRAAAGPAGSARRRSRTSAAAFRGRPLSSSGLSLGFSQSPFARMPSTANE